MIDLLRRRLLRARSFELAPLLAAAAVGRLHVAGLGLAVLLEVEATTGSLAAAGTAAGAFSLGVGATRPVQGRLLDRLGRRSLPSIVALHAALAAALLLAPGTGLQTALAFALGFTCPALSVVMRAVIAACVAPPRRPVLLGVDHALQNTAFAVGPLIAGAVAAVASPGAAVVVLVLIGVAGTLAVAALAPLERTRTGRRALSRPQLRPIARPLALTVGHGMVYGALGVAGVAAVLADGGDHLAGPAVAAVFAGGLAGDLLIAPRQAGTPLPARLRTRTWALLAVVTLAAVTPGTVPLLLAALVACGAALAVVGVTVLLDVAARAKQPGRAEAFGWAGAALRLGDAIGAAGAGVFAEASGARAAMLVAVAGAAIAVGCAAVRGAPRPTAGKHPALGPSFSPTVLGAAAAAAFVAALATRSVVGQDLVPVAVAALVAAGLVLLGATLRRPVVALVPAVLAAGLAAWVVASPPPDLDDGWAALLAALVVLTGLAASACVAAGALLRR